jgi:hypothetical protein
MNNFACGARICAQPTRNRTGPRPTVKTFTWPLPCPGRQNNEDGDETRGGDEPTTGR